MAFKERGDNVMILNTTFNYKINRRKVQHEIKLELKNMLGGKAKLFEYYDEAERKIDLAKQLPLVPSIYYVFYF